MVFSTPYFLFLYLPIVLLLYYIVPLKFRNLVLLIVSLIFYGWGEPIYILIMFASIIIDYTHGMLVLRGKKTGKMGLAKGAVVSSVILNLGLLFFFKYWDFIAGSLASVGLDFMPSSILCLFLDASTIFMPSPYSNSALTNSLLSNSCMSSIFSPTPMNLTGMSSSVLIEITIPPFAVPSSLLSTRPVISAEFLNSFA